jgi:hypothetical protein
MLKAEKLGKRILPINERTELIRKIHLQGHHATQNMVGLILDTGVWWEGLHDSITNELGKCMPRKRLPPTTIN